MSIEPSLEFQKALNEACEKQYRGFLYGESYFETHSEVAETMEEIQQQREEIENKVEEFRVEARRIRRESHPHMREILASLKRRSLKKSGGSGLICPACGEGDHGNRMNGKPVCMMSSKHRGLGPVLLVSPKKAKEWKFPDKKVGYKESWELSDNEIVRVKK